MKPKAYLFPGTVNGFRNADSALTQAAFDGVAATSADPQEVLATSYRSREGIIGFVNDAFGPAFAAMDLPAAEHAFSGTARKEDGFTHAPFAVWWLEGKLDLQYAALAAVSPTVELRWARNAGEP